MVATFLILLLLNGVPVAACLLLGAVRWASTLALVATIVSALIALAADGVRRSFGLPARPFSLTPFVDVSTLFALSLEILFLTIVNRQRVRSAPGRRFWLVALHDKLHG